MSKENKNASFKTHWDTATSGYREMVLPKEVCLFRADIIKATYSPGGEWEDGTDFGVMPSILSLETKDGRTFQLISPQINLPRGWFRDDTEIFKDMQVESIGVVPDEDLLAIRLKSRWDVKAFEIKSPAVDIYHSRRARSQNHVEKPKKRFPKIVPKIGRRKHY
jgi:hypothetical protein